MFLQEYQPILKYFLQNRISLCKAFTTLIDCSKCAYVGSHKISFRLCYRKCSSSRDRNFDYFEKNIDYRLTTVQQHVENHENAPAKILEAILPTFSPNSYLPDMVWNCLSTKDNIENLTDAQLKSVLQILATEGICNRKHAVTLQSLDHKLCACTDQWPLDFVLYAFDAWYLMQGKSVVYSKYFLTAIDCWSRRIDELSKNNVVQIVYHMGLCKKVPGFLMELLMNRLEAHFMDELTDTEWALICLSYFRTSTKLNSSKILPRIVEVAHRLIENNERFHLINVTKCLRHAQHYDKELILALQDYATDKADTFNFVECTNFLAMFSSQNVYFSNTFALLEKQAMKSLLDEKQCQFPLENSNPKEHPSIQSRGKDISRFLWALVHTGHEPKIETINTVLALVEAKWFWGEYDLQFHVFVDCLHSLAIINIYPYTLLKKVFHPRFLKQIWNMKRVKPRFQLYFIYKSIEIEFPDFHLFIPQSCFPYLKQMKPLFKDLNKQMTERNELGKVLALLKQHQSEDKPIQCLCILPHIVLLGIIFDSKLQGSETIGDRHFNATSITEGKKHELSDVNDNLICFEILDASVCCRESNQLLGLMKVKLRQLAKLPCRLIIWTSDDIQTLNTMSKSEQRDKIVACLN